MTTETPQQHAAMKLTLRDSSFCEFYLDENEHLLFIFADGSEMDFVVHPPTAEKVEPLLAKLGIEWEKRFMLHFDSHILYPPQYAGQKYYDEGARWHN
ncbi:MAG: hypothetical protein IJB33_01070 [Akkermansia sp.]|nr:hypothetical protein [Akkermansia sp.]